MTRTRIIVFALVVVVTASMFVGGFRRNASVTGVLNGNAYGALG